jgi:hypothetical protein
MPICALKSHDVLELAESEEPSGKAKYRATNHVDAGGRYLSGLDNCSRMAAAYEDGMQLVALCKCEQYVSREESRARAPPLPAALLDEMADTIVHDDRGLAS